MGNAFTDYEVLGKADPRRVRTAAAVDLGIGGIAALLVWPFPVARIVLTDMTGSVAWGWVVHVALLLAAMVVADGVVSSVFAVVLGRTAGMYFQDLGFVAGSPRWGAAPAFGARWAAAGTAGLFGLSGPASGISRDLGATRVGS